MTVQKTDPQQGMQSYLTPKDFATDDEKIRLIIQEAKQGHDESIQHASQTLHTSAKKNNVLSKDPKEKEKAQREQAKDHVKQMQPIKEPPLGPFHDE